MSIEKGDGRLTPEDSEEAEETPVRGEGFLAAFLRRRDEELTEPVEHTETEESEEDEEEQEGSIFQRFRTAFGKRLKNLVTFEPLPVSETIPEDTEAEEEASGEEPIEFPLESGASLSIFDNTHEEAAPEFEEIDDVVVTPAEPETAPDGSSTEEKAAEVSEVATEEDVLSFPPEVPLVERTDAIPPLPPIDSEAGGSSAMPIAAERTPAEEPEIPGHRHKVDTALGLGLLYEHHRVTKKAKEAEKRDNEQINEIEDLKKEQKSQKETKQEQVIFEQKTENHRQPVQEKAPEINAVPTVEKPAIEARMPKTEQIPTVGQIIAERAPMPKERLEMPEFEQPNTNPERKLTIDPKELFKPDLEQSTEILLQQIEAAAEKGIALEGQYERRHELKDVASTTSEEAVGGFGVSRPPETTTNPYQYEASGANNGSSIFTKLREQMSVEENQRAMSAGLWGGVMVVIALIVWAVV